MIPQFDFRACAHLRLLSLLPVVYMATSTSGSAYNATKARDASVIAADNVDGNKTYSHVFADGALPGAGKDGSKQGDPTTFSWSIVPDGTDYRTSTTDDPPTVRRSSIVSFYDNAFSVATTDQTADLTNRIWFPAFSDAVGLISKRSGVTYVYEPNDTGSICYLGYSSTDGVGERDPGEAGVRGDLRIAGSADFIAGGLSGSATGNLFHDEVYFDIDRFTDINSIRFVIGHEVMHAVGFSHSTVNGSASQSAVTGRGGTSNGPQFDDICGLHRKYGDFFEKVNTTTQRVDQNGQPRVDLEGNPIFELDTNGNDILANATDLGAIDISGSIIIGDDADDTTVAIDEFDFISIDGLTDQDFLKFTVDTASEYKLTLDPRGPTYTYYFTDTGAGDNDVNVETIDADRLNNLDFTLYDSSGEILNTVNTAAIGESEVLSVNLSAGVHYVRVNGQTSPDPQILTTTGNGTQIAAAQMYAFSVESTLNRPVANNLSLSMTSGAFGVTLSGSDPDGDTLTYTVVSNPTNGTLSGSAPDLSYTPAPGFLGADTFTYIVSDGGLDSLTATVTIYVYGLSTASDGLIAEWKLDDASGTVAADLTGRYPGTVNNATWADGQTYGALDFDTTTSRVVIPVAALQGLDKEITIAMWVNGDSTQPRTDSTFYAVNSAGTRVLNIHLPWSDSKVYWDAGNSSGYDRIISEAADASTFKNGWNHWVFTKNTNDDGTMKIYLNGNPEPWHSGDGKTKTMAGITAGAFGGQITGFSYDGRLDDVSLYNVELTPAEIQGLYSTSLVKNYASWLTLYPTLSTSGASSDSEQDGVPRLLEYVLNGNPLESDVEIEPQVDLSGENFVFSFTRRVASTSDTVQTFQYGSSLSGWTDVNITNPVGAGVVLGTPVDGLQTVTVTINKSVAEDSRLFGRLKVTD